MIKAKDIIRADVLVEAAGQIDDFEEAVSKSRPKDNYKYHNFSIGVGPSGESGMESDAWIELDYKTGLLLMPHIRTAIFDELKKLGVDIS